MLMVSLPSFCSKRPASQTFSSRTQKRYTTMSFGIMSQFYFQYLFIKADTNLAMKWKKKLSWLVHLTTLYPNSNTKKCSSLNFITTKVSVKYWIKEAVPSSFLAPIWRQQQQKSAGFFALFCFSYLFIHLSHGCSPRLFFWFHSSTWYNPLIWVSATAYQQHL